MTHAEEILMLMQDGTPYSLREIMDATGLAEKAARTAIYRLMQAGFMSSKPTLYSVTPEAERQVQSVRAGERVCWKPDKQCPVRPRVVL